jgi:protein-S-isoprenylcysteine O-methyltransferase Ste14
MRMLKLVLKWGATVAVFAGVLFGSAGRLDLPMVWAYLCTYAGLLLVFGVVTSRRDPNLLKERRRAGEGAKTWDRILLAIYGVLFFGTWIVAGVDVGRFHWSDTVPLWLQIAGLVVCIAAFGLVWWATWVNTFFSRVVRIQEDRGHRVVTAGPYRYVRHPGYTGNVFAWPGTALALGSWWAMLPAMGIVLIYILRTALEDRTLQAELDGYQEYAEQVRYRLLPGVW